MSRRASLPSRTTSRRGGSRSSSPRGTDAHGADTRGADNHPGIHLLRDLSVAHRLVRSAGVAAGDLVLELGSGTGALTGPLADSGARVIAVERDPRFVARLERRFADTDNVKVVAADARTVPLPRRAYVAVANIPYALSTALLRRLLGPDDTSLARADLVVEWGFAKRVTAPVPRDLELAWWQVRFELGIAGRVPASSFRPEPSVDSAHLTIRRRANVSRSTARAAARLLRSSYQAPHRQARDIVGAHVPKKRAHRLLTSTGIDPPTSAGTVPTESWLRLAAEISRNA